MNDLETDNHGLVELAEIIKELNSRWTPLEWQIPFVRALFYEGVTDLGAQCGRGAGKSEVSAYCIWRWAMENPNSENYFIGPLFNQMKEIMWASNRIQSFGPEDWIQSINNTELRITFKNGSFLKMEGSNNAEKLRGIKPRGLIIWDEGKDCDVAAIEAMDANRARYNSPMIFIGTPPEKHGFFIDRMKWLQNDKKSFFTTATSYDNKHNNKEWLDRKREQLLFNGLEDIWRREYLAEFVLGGHRSVFPMIAKKGSEILEDIWPKDSNKWVLWIGLDPASSSTFGIVFFLMNPYTRKVIAVDEIHETRPDFMSARKIFDAVNIKIDKFKKRGIKEVNLVYDNAARWFKTEINDIDKDNKWWLIPCDKTAGLQGEISAWRGVVAHGLFTFTDKSKELKKELDNYILDEKGRLPDKEDDLMQAGAYALKAMGFDYSENLEPKQQEDTRRGFSIHTEFQENEYKEID
jgi:hypothetical protein